MLDEHHVSGLVERFEHRNMDTAQGTSDRYKVHKVPAPVVSSH